MKWWKPLLIFLLCATPSGAGFWSDFPGVGPGTVLNGVIIDNSTINSSTLNQPVINDPTFNGTLTFNPGTVVNYDPSTIINGPDGSIWYSNGIYNLKNLDLAAGGVITIGGVPAGGACPANQYYIALSSSLVPTCAPITSIPGPVTISNPTFTGTVTMPDGGTWTGTGINMPPTSSITVGSINITGPPPSLTFNGVPMGGSCVAGDFVNSISSTGIPGCATPAGGGGGTGPPLPLSVGNGGLGQGTAPVAGQILVAQAGGTMYSPVSMTGDATISPSGVLTITKPLQPLTSTSVTAPTNPINGQLWFDPLTLQTYLWYTDPTSSQWVPVVNLFAANVSGSGPCPAGQYVNTLNPNAPPTCGSPTVVGLAPTTPYNGQLWFNPTDLQTYVWYTDPTSSQWVPVVNVGGVGGAVPPPGSTIDSPTFTGTIHFPDGSYYDANGHEVMKNLGVGVVANVDGVGGVSGNSIVVANSGWLTNGWWDSSGLEQMYDIASEWLDLGHPSTGINGWQTINTDPENTAQNNPWGELDLYNYSAPTTPEAARDQRWQAEGFEDLNAIGIHQQTWQQGCTGTIVSGAYLSDCAIAAVPSSLNDNLGYKILIANPSTGTNAAALLELTTGTGGSIYPTYLQVNGSGYTANPAFPSSSAMLVTSEPNGLYLGTNTSPNTVNFTMAGSVVATINHNGLVLPNITGPSVFWGSATTPTASITSAGSSNLNLFAGAHYTSGNNWVADAPTAEQIAMYNAPAVNIGINSGLTVGTAFTPDWIASFTPTGLNIAKGSLFILGQNQFQSGSFTPTLHCAGGDPTVSAGSQIGNWWTAGHMLFYYIQVFWNGSSGGAGQAYVGGLPYAAIGTGGGQGGMEQQVVSTNASSTRSSTRMVASVMNGENIVRLYDAGSYGGDYLAGANCANTWANTPSGIFLTGWYAYQ